MKINVLWIDDKPNDNFIDWAFEYDDENPIDIHNELSVDEGFKELLKGDVLYEAIILDANCHYRAEEKGKNTKLSALNYALKSISENSVLIPWFVYTGFGKEGGKESIENAIEPYMSDRRKYDETLFYNKPSDMEKLFAKIIEVVKSFKETQYKMKFADVYEDYPHQKQLLDILKFLDKKPGEKATAFHLIRNEIEYIFSQCHNIGLIQEKFKEHALTENSKYLGQSELEFIVPKCIQELIRKLIRICNPESHYIENDECEKIDYTSYAPYLERTTIYDFLNVVHWFNKFLPTTENGIKDLQTKVAFALSNSTVEPSLKTINTETEFSKYEGKEMVVEQDEENNYHCGECHLPFKIAKEQNALGKKVVLNHVSKNDNKGSKYPYHASFKLKE